MSRAKGIVGVCGGLVLSIGFLPAIWSTAPLAATGEIVDDVCVSTGGSIDAPAGEVGADCPGGIIAPPGDSGGSGGSGSTGGTGGSTGSDGSAPASGTSLSGADMGTFASVPILTVESVPPLVMIAMSMDHQYFIKAYNDYTDLDKNGTVERTYSDEFEYYGYFHPDLCYRYDDGNQRFDPIGTVDNPRANAGDGSYDHYCTVDGASWSGNFLNWATMTRMDVVRKILFGGLRATDTESLTVLERAYLPADAHSFTKYYNGADLAKLTPHDAVRTDAANGGNGNGFDDADEGITLCNTTFAGTSGSSQSVPTPPMMRVVSGNYQLWSANERWQCTWQNERGTNRNSNDPALSGIAAGAGDPPDAAQLKTPGASRDHTVRVKVCDSAKTAPQNLENCRAYGSNLKPEGLLQKYGLDGQMKFGLVTGSYADNVSGGRLRKRVSAINDEVDSTNGTFKVLDASTPGIIKALNAVRIWGYGYDDGTYLSGGEGGDNCPFQLTDIATEGKCASWGNPMSEIYLEALRYFAASNRAPTPAFVNGGTDNNYIPGFLEEADWGDPLSTENSCASLNAIIFNASVSSYDDDQTNPSGLTADTAAALTKTIGEADGENLEGENFFVGRSGAATNEFCTAKTINGSNGLGDVYGLCPEAPTVRGSYHMAGLAHFAHTEDLRGDLPEQQSVKTFAVSLATAAPVIEIPVGDGRIVRVLPAYRLRKGGNNANEALNNPANDGGGAIVDFKIVRPHTEVSPTNNAVPQPGSGVYSGFFYVNWEDSEQGGDYDQDMWGTIEYRLDTNAKGGELRITTNAVAQSTITPQLFGFVTSGTTQDGFHAYSGILGANFTDPTGVKGCSNCTHLGASGGQRGPQSFDFTLGEDGAAGLLESPLYYAAKWGGFTDLDRNKKPTVDGEPDNASEWDGDGDGLPDTFFFVTDPGALEASLREVFDSILERVSSGTAAAVVANEQKGNGALFQALYDPEKSDVDGNTARWIGTLHALFVDTHGFIREDGNRNGRIDDFSADPVVRLEFDESVDPSERRTRLIRYVPIEDDPSTSALEGVDPRRPDPSDATQFTPSAPVDLFGGNGLKTLWNARERLSELDEATITQQRDYTALADTGRHVFTWFDDSHDDNVDSGEVVEFTASTIDNANYFWLDARDPASAKRLVDWVRGKENGMTGFRKRTVDYDGTDGPRGAEVMRLGDIINSTPVSVAAPFAGFDQAAQDPSYAEFRTHYQNRRQVVYVGANDGMIHAFNAGFFNASELAFELAPPGTTGVTRHPLGSELWAYVPKNLLPHLQWLGRPDYSHVYFMDSPVRVFDVRIFESDDTHINGWGTILVAGMRFGGGDDDSGIVVNYGADADAGNDVRTKSAYVVLDVTDPESPPRLIAELAPANLQYSTSIPQVVGFGDSSGESAGKWYLLFGTGPNDLASATYASPIDAAGQPVNAAVYAYDLAALLGDSSSDGAALVRKATLAEANVFIGDIAGADFDIDMKDEAVYFGTVGAPVVPGANPDDVAQGSLYRMVLGESPASSEWSSPTKLLTDLNRPFVTQPTVTIDRKLRRWVVAASGRLYVNEDKLTENQQSAYGIIDPAFSGGIEPNSVADLVDVSAARVYSNDTVEGVALPTGADTNADGALNTTELREAVALAGGWRKDFAVGGRLPSDAPVGDNGAGSAATPAERNISRVSLFGGIMFASLYTPSTDLCGADGSSRLLAVDFSTGVTPSFGVFFCMDCDDPTVPLPESFDQGGGFSSSASIHFGEQTIEGKVTVITQDSRGELESTEALTGSAEPAAEISWREYRGGETGLLEEAGSNAPPLDEDGAGGGSGGGLPSP